MAEPIGAGPARATVVFDFDGTLARGDCCSAFLRWLIYRHPLRWLAALLASLVLAPGLFMKPLRRRAVSGYLWLGTVGLRGGGFEALLGQFIAQHALRPIDASVAALREEVSRGHRVVVATGALQPVADALLRRMQLRDQVALVGSESTRWAAGLVAGQHCVGAGKVKRLHAQGFPGPFLRAYSDSWTDFPLLDDAEEPVLVNGSPATRQRLRQRYGKRLRIVVWN